MMRTILGAAIGGLVAGIVALVASAQVRSTPASPYGADPNNPYAMPVVNTSGISQGATVQCAPYQEPMLRRVIVAGREVAEVTCVTRMNDQSMYYAPQPAYAQSDVVSMPARARTVSQPVRERVVYRERATTSRESDRSWGKTAMIIGGSSGAGAGIGGLVGGKKGALIGAAIGGGAATIYESTKR